jgi:hypothetical protein
MKIRATGRWLPKSLNELHPYDGAGKLAGRHKMRPRGLKPALGLRGYAALKRRSSTVQHGFVSFSGNG